MNKGLVGTITDIANSSLNSNDRFPVYIIDPNLLKAEYSDFPKNGYKYRIALYSDENSLRVRNADFMMSDISLTATEEILRGTYRHIENYLTSDLMFNHKLQYSTFNRHLDE